MSPSAILRTPTLTAFDEGAKPEGIRCYRRKRVNELRYVFVPSGRDVTPPSYFPSRGKR